VCTASEPFRQGPQMRAGGRIHSTVREANSTFAGIDPKIGLLSEGWLALESPER
jgi:hypothetical protein